MSLISLKRYEIYINKLNSLFEARLWPCPYISLLRPARMCTKDVACGLCQARPTASHPGHVVQMSKERKELFEFPGTECSRCVRSFLIRSFFYIIGQLFVVPYYSSSFISFTPSSRRRTME